MKTFFAILGVTSLLAFFILPEPHNLLAFAPFVASVLYFGARWPDGSVLSRAPLDAVVAMIVAAAAVVLFASSAAIAADAPLTAGSFFSDIRGTLETLLGVVASGIAALIAWGVHRLLGVQLDKTTRGALQSAMENGIHAGLNAIQGLADARPIAVKNKTIEVALGYVKQFAPGAIKHFGLTDDRLAELLRVQLAKVLPTDTTAITGPSPNPYAR